MQKLLCDSEQINDQVCLSVHCDTHCSDKALRAF